MRYLLLFILFWSSGIMAQNLPSACLNLPSGVKPGGDFDIRAYGLCDGGQMQEQALTFAIKKSTIDGQLQELDNVKFIVGFKFNESIENLPPKQLPKDNAGNFTVNVNKEAGNYWVMALGKVGSQTYATCKSFEVKHVSNPKVDIDVCTEGKVKIKILNSPENNFDTYSWAISNGGEKGSFSPSTNKALPFEKILNVSSENNETIVFTASFLDNNLDKSCTSIPIIKQTKPSDKPVHINQLEGLEEEGKWILKFEDYEVDQLYEVEKKENDQWKNIGTGLNGEVTLKNIPTDNQVCFRIPSANECKNITNSNEVCTNFLTTEVATSGAIDIRWQAFKSNPSSLTIRKTVLTDHSKSKNLNLANTLSTNFRDVNIDCSEKYSYSIKAAFKENEKAVTIITPPALSEPLDATQIPIPKGLMIISFDKKVDNKMVAYIRNEVSLVQQFAVFGSNKEDGDFIQLQNSKDSTFIIGQKTNYQSELYFYYSFINKCELTSVDSPKFKSIYLERRDERSISWTEFEIPMELDYPNENTIYYLTRLNPETDLYEEVKVLGDDLENEDISDLLKEKGGKFRIKATKEIDFGNGFETITIYSNAIEFRLNINAFIPTAFTPNNDNINDSFQVFSNGSGKMQIFNRWGEIIFQTDDLEKGWDGRFDNGQEAPVGVYSYNINLVIEGQKLIKQKGQINLIR